MTNEDNQETRYLRLALPAGGLRLEKGGVLKVVDVAYETAGTLSPSKDNVIFICHALTGDSHVAGSRRGDPRSRGWWFNMVKDGGGIDTSRFFVICANVLGGCSGTTGPSSIDPDTGRPYGSTFPDVTVRDIVEVHHMLLRQLGFERIHAVIGGSFGGMQALEFAIRHPAFASRIVAIATGASITAQALAFDVVGRGAIMEDPNFRGGDYYGTISPSAGLAQARKLAHITYLSNALMRDKFGRRRRLVQDGTQEEDIFEVESYLEHQGRKFVGRFDANSYLRITQAMDEFDLPARGGGGVEGLETALKPVRARVLIVALSGDWLFLPAQSEALFRALRSDDKDASYFCLEAPAGHDAFLTHIDELSRVLGSFLPAEPRRDPVKLDPDHQRDYAILEKMVPEGAKKILDLACGDGRLLNFLSERRKGLRCTGLDIDTASGARVLAAGHNAVRADIDGSLAAIPDDSFDCAVLSESLQVMRRPDKALRELLRIAPSGVVSFPNFGMWKIVYSLGILRRMPVTKRLPYQWYDTPNIHLCTVKDFLLLCKELGIEVEKVHYLSTLFLSRLFRLFGLRHLGSSRVIVKIRRKQ